MEEEKVLMIPDIHDFIFDMFLLHAKNKAVSLKVANSVVHVYHVGLFMYLFRAC